MKNRVTKPTFSVTISPVFDEGKIMGKNRVKSVRSFVHNILGLWMSMEQVFVTLKASFKYFFDVLSRYKITNPTNSNRKSSSRERLTPFHVPLRRPQSFR
jgi:hypothetical protein